MKGVLQMIIKLYGAYLLEIAGWLLVSLSGFWWTSAGACWIIVADLLFCKFMWQINRKVFGIER